MKELNMRMLLIASLSLGLLTTAGCVGQLKKAMREHAETTRTVSGTLTKSAGMIKCEDMKQDSVESCKAAVTTINDQAKVLNESGDKLGRSAE
jgi:hypothetical protein